MATVRTGPAAELEVRSTCACVFVAIAEQFGDGSQQHMSLCGLLSVEHQRCLLRELLYVIVDSPTEFQRVPRRVPPYRPAGR